MALVIDETVTADGNTDFNWVPHRKEAPLRGTIFAYGTFDSGTVTLQASPDGGTTFIDVPDSTGASTQFTANGIVNFELYANQNPISSEVVKLRLALSGATSPSITYRVFDLT